MSCLNCKKDVPIENEDTGLCATCNKKSRDQSSLYSAVRKEFIRAAIRNGATCPRCHKEIDEFDDVHHKAGRQGYADAWAREMDIELLIDVRFFVAVCRPCHNYIEVHPQEAKAKGWSLSRLATNLPSPISPEGLEEIKRKSKGG